jgi:hypothetical protein
MQKDKESARTLEKMIGNNENSVKRTTIILEREEREFIDSLIRDGKELGIKPLISKMLRIYKSMMMYEWHFPGQYYWGISRMALVNVELLNIFIQSIPKDKRREIGRKMGEATKVSIETTIGVQTSDQEKWLDVFDRWKVQGFGDFYLKDKYLLIKTPFINESEIWAGLLEGLFGVELDVKTTSPPLVFETKKPTNEVSD